MDQRNNLIFVTNLLFLFGSSARRGIVLVPTVVVTDFIQSRAPECEGAALESLLESHDKTRDVVLSQDIPLLMTKATGKPHGET